MLRRLPTRNRRTTDPVLARKTGAGKNERGLRRGARRPLNADVSDFLMSWITLRQVEQGHQLTCCDSLIATKGGWCVSKFDNSNEMA